MRAPSKDVTELLRECARQGFAVERRGSGHYAVRSAGGDVVTVASSPRATVAPAVGRLRRLGLVWKGR